LAKRCGGQEPAAAFFFARAIAKAPGKVVARHRGDPPWADRPAEKKFFLGLTFSRFVLYFQESCYAQGEGSFFGSDRAGTEGGWSNGIPEIFLGRRTHGSTMILEIVT